jgi:hypothetical protein
VQKGRGGGEEVRGDSEQTGEVVTIRGFVYLARVTPLGGVYIG